MLQLSIPTSDPARLLALGARLRPLRESGVLVIGSGFMTHGLPFVTREMIAGRPCPAGRRTSTRGPPRRWRGATWRRWPGSGKAPGMPYAHPTADHFLPLFVTLGAAADPSAPVQTVIDGYWMGFAKRSFQVS